MQLKLVNNPNWRSYGAYLPDSSVPWASQCLSFGWLPEAPSLKERGDDLTSRAVF
ncbi:MAG: hypothetical protein AAFX46_10420 [Cyanobacteria bacterium J06636_27]